MNTPKFAFFGTPKFAADILEGLALRGILPAVVITSPDKPQGRKLTLTPSEVKIRAKERNIPVLEPEKLDEHFSAEIKSFDCELFVLAAYGKIFPQEIIDIPKHGILVWHPSLLPKLRGASPMISAILTEEKTGVTIMAMDEKMDHGPIIAQKELEGIVWPPHIAELEKSLAEMGAELLAETIPAWVSGKIIATPQDHELATFCKKIKKEDGLIDPEGNAEQNYRKFCAFEKWPRTYFFKEVGGKNLRIIITDAALEDGKFVIKKVLPEGGREASWEEFQKRF